MLRNRRMIKPPGKLDDAFPRSNILEALGELLPLKAVVLLLGTALLIVCGYYFSLFATHGFALDFLKINKCVESGGRWNADLRICEPLPGTYILQSPASSEY
jgi:hypothetical protein